MVFSPFLSILDNSTGLAHFASEPLISVVVPAQVAIGSIVILLLLLCYFE